MSERPDAPIEAERTEATRQAGRGALALSGAKAFFIVLGFAQQLILFAVLGMANYGAFRSAQSPASITYNTLVTTGILGMSRVTSQASNRASVMRALALHAALGTVVAVGFFAMAPWLAETLGAPHIATPLQLLALVIFLYGLYAPLVGIFNGQRKFLHQAGLDSTAAVLRTIGLIAGAWYCVHVAKDVSAVSGAVTGFVISAVVILSIALALLRRGGDPSSSEGANLSTADHMGFIGPVVVGQGVLNLLLQADVNVLRFFSSRAASAAGLDLTAADPLVGAYSATQLFGFLPYQLMVGLGFILFPMLSKAAKEGDRAAIGSYVRNGVRVAVLVTGILVSVCAAVPHALLRFVYSADAADLGAPALRTLSIGLGAFAVFGAMVTVLNGLKRQWHSMLITAGAFVMVVAGDALLLDGQTFGPQLLQRTALGTSAALWLTTLVTAYFVKRVAGAVVSLATVARVIGAVTVCILAGMQLPAMGKIVTPFYALLIVGIYVAVLLLSRELGKADLDALKAIVLRRKRAG
jgi:stage V sporulation protein B